MTFYARRDFCIRRLSVNADMSNDADAQNDEMLALESIFDSDEFSVKKENGEFNGHFNAYVSLPGEVKVEYQLQTFTKSIKQKDQISVRYLPPIELSFTLPADYPSTSPPRFTMVCSWLGRKLISKLCEKLDTIWNENKGLEILYLWLSFLKEESFTYLGLDTTIDISKQYSFNKRQLEKRKSLRSNEVELEQPQSTIPADAATSSTAQSSMPGTATGSVACGNSRGRGKSSDKRRNGADGHSYEVEADPQACSANAHPKEENRMNENPVKLKPVQRGQDHHSRPKRPALDPRAVSCEFLQTPLINYILDYNKARSDKDFQRNIYACMICFEDKPGSQCIEFNTCGHIFCRECVGAYFEVTIKDGNVHGLTCPERGCKSKALHSQICDLVSPELFARYDELLLSSTLDEMEDIVYCPRKTCQYPVTYDKAETMARCAHCSYTFCILCRMGYHGIDPCRLRLDAGLIAEYKNASQERKEFLEKKHGRRRIQTFIETCYSEQWIKGNSKSCPHCQAAIEKSEGCNKMSCWKCNTFFCWLCNTRLNPTNPYNHFNSPSSACFKKLFHGFPESDTDDDDDDDNDDDDDEFRIFQEFML